MKQEILIKDYQPVLDSMKQRKIRIKKIKVIDYTPKEGEEPLIGVEGMIIAFVTRPGSDILKLVKNATKDKKAATALKELVKKQSKKFKPVSLTKAVDMLAQSDVFAELRLDTEILVQTLFIPKEADFIFEEFAYNGGPLPLESFRLLERIKEGSDSGLEAVILKINPRLTDAEKAALNKVPSSQWVQNMYAATCCGDSYTAVGVMVAAVVATVLLACLMPVPLVQSIPKEELVKLGPSASARKLLQLRQDAIMRNWPQE